MSRIRQGIRALQKEAGLCNPEWETEFIVALPNSAVRELRDIAQERYLFFMREVNRITLIGVAGLLAALVACTFFIAGGSGVSLGVITSAILALVFLVPITLGGILYFAIVAEYHSLYFAMTGLLSDRERHSAP